MSRRYEEAITESRKSLELDPDYWLALWFQGQALEQLGRYAEALPPLKKGHMALADNPSVLVAEEARVYALSGRRADALRTLDQLMAMSKRTQVSKYAIASVYGAGRQRPGLRPSESSLRRALDEPGIPQGGS
ncbi:MAG TPA: hypothetical protein VLY04_25130 [Bryobacteraceae bacterium]|nr:hypothetical protein [Bryobacteraceae bacterium]